MSAKRTPVEIFAANLGAFMKERDLDHGKLSALSGVSVGAIQKYVRGVRDPRTTEVSKIAKALARPPGDFFMENPPPAQQAEIAPVALKVIRKEIKEDENYRDIWNDLDAAVERARSAFAKRAREVKAKQRSKKS